MSVDAAVLAQELLAAFGDGDTQAVRCRAPRDIAAVDGVLPDRQPWAGGAPGVDHLGIKPRLARDPFDEVEHQCVCRLTHPLLLHVLMKCGLSSSQLP